MCQKRLQGAEYSFSAFSLDCAAGESNAHLFHENHHTNDRTEHRFERRISLREEGERWSRQWLSLDALMPGLRPKPPMFRALAQVYESSQAV